MNRHDLGQSIVHIISQNQPKFLTIEGCGGSGAVLCEITLDKDTHVCLNNDFLSTVTLNSSTELTVSTNVSMVLYMSFDKFLLAVESRDLSQADNSIIRVPSLTKLSDLRQNFFFCLSTTEA